MTAIPRLSELGTGRKRSVPEDGGVISDDSPERTSSRSSQPSIGKRSNPVRIVNSLIQNAFLDTRTSTPTLKLVSAGRSGLTFPPPNSVRQLHQNQTRICIGWGCAIFEARCKEASSRFITISIKHGTGKVHPKQSSCVSQHNSWALDQSSCASRDANCGLQGQML